MTRRRVAWKALGLLACTGALALAVAIRGSWRFNSSGSLPRGLYRLLAATPRRRDLVLVCPPVEAAALARQRGYLRRGNCPGGVRALGKLLLAAPGDRVEVSAAGLAVDGRPVPGSRPLAADAAGRPLPRLREGAYRVAPGEAWVYTPHPRSFDSRYFGPVAGRQIRGTLRPLWVTRSTAADRALLAQLARPGAGS